MIAHITSRLLIFTEHKDTLDYLAGEIFQKTDSGTQELLLRTAFLPQMTADMAEDIGAYFMWPRQGSTVSSVAVIGGTGLKGMRAADANQYFAGGSGFPDFMFFSLNMLTEGEKGLKAAGYYDNNWKVSNDWVEQK